MSIDNKLLEAFQGKIVRKDLVNKIKGGLNVPVYVLEYLLGMYCATDNEVQIQEGVAKVKDILAKNYVRPDEKELIKSRIKEKGRYKVIDKVTVKLNEKDDVYEVNFTSVCFGKKIKHGGWSGSYRIRLFKNGIGKYNDNVVHEAFITEGKIAKLQEEIFHYSYEDLADYLSKFNRYTSEGAREYFKRGKKSNIFWLVINPIFKFIRMYVFRLGFLDGIEGLLLAILSSNYTMVKYYKLLEMNRRDKNGN